jgi:hypothetical protein
MKDSSPTIRGVRSTFEETFRFEMVDDGHHRARGDRQEVADGLLRLVHVTLDGVQYGEMTRFESERADHLTELT